MSSTKYAHILALPIALGLLACGGQAPAPAAPAQPAPALATPASDAAPTADAPAQGDIPPVVLTSMNINPNADAGPGGSALYIVDVEKGALHIFPFSTIEGGPVVGQGMHTALTPDNRKVYVTIGGNAELSLRVYAIALDWTDRVPTPRVVKQLDLVEAGTPGNEANGAACHPGGPGIRQEGHGTRITRDGRFLTLSELQNDRVRVLDTRTDTFVGEPTTHDSLFAPHGLYPNPAGTLAATPQYWFDHNTISLWAMDEASGALSHAGTVPLVDGELEGSYQHTVRWLDDTRFFTNVTQERHQGNGRSEQSVWLVDTEARTSTAVLKADAILEGVSDLAIAGGKLYVAEGNVAQFLAGEETPGHVSVWDLADPQAPRFVKRLSAGEGFPEDFSNAHSLGATADGGAVFVESFSTNYLIEIETQGDTVTRTFGSADGLDTPHGIYLLP